MQDRGPTRIELGFVNAYLLEGTKGFVLVDTGMASQRKKLEEALAAAGCGRGSLALVVVTHADYDHMGNCPWLRDEWGAPVAIHGADRETLETGAAPRRFMRGWLGKLLTLILSLRPAGLPTCPADVLLEDGQSLEAWGVAARVLHLPGHTRGAIGLLMAEGVFIAGDVFANWRRPAPSPFIQDLEAYRASLAKVLELVPASATVWPGHGGPFPATAIAAMKL
jgi:glyoxylase-like metal-dependent hydrolase (beta-lactamase superfamily II)